MKTQAILMMAGMLLAATLEVATGAELRGYGIFKGQDFVQTGTSAGVPVSDYPGYSFAALLQPTSPFTNQIQEASLQPTNREAQPFQAPLLNSAAPLVVRFNASSQAALDAAYPTGIYQFAFTSTVEGNRRMSLVMATNAFPTNAPRIANFPDAQSLDPSKPFTLRWDAFQGGTTNDYIGLQIYDAAGQEVFRTASFAPEANRVALNGTNTSLVLPAGTLHAGQSYGGYLFFEKDVVTETNAYRGAIGLVGFSKGTSFSLRTPGTASGLDVAFYGLFKGQDFQQSGDLAPSAVSVNGFHFAALVQPNGVYSGQVTAAVLARSGGASVPLEEPLLGGGAPWSKTLAASDQAVIDSVYPAGRYGLSFQTARGGALSIPLDLPANSFPPVPQIQDWAGAQSLVVTRPIVLQWKPFVGGGAKDLISLVIRDAQGSVAFRTALFRGELGYVALSGADLSLTLPPGTLQPGASYSGTLLFEKDVVRDSFSYPGVDGVVGFYRQTRFALQTSIDLSPYLMLASSDPAAGIRLRLLGQEGFRYALQRADNLRTPAWISLVTNRTFNGTFEFIDTTAARTGQRFYRAVPVE